MGAVISIEEIFKCAHMKTMARTSSAVLPLLLSPQPRHPPLWIWEELKPFPTTTAYTVYTNFPIRQSPSENTEGYELEKSCHSTLPFSKMPLPRGDNAAHHLRRKNNVIASHFPLLGKLCLQSKCSTLKMQKTYCPFLWRLHFSRIYVCTTYLLTWVNKYLSYCILFIR